MPKQEPAPQPVRLTPVAERDKALKDHLGATHIFDEKANDLWKPDSVPADPSPDDD